MAQNTLISAIILLFFLRIWEFSPFLDPKKKHVIRLIQKTYFAVYSALTLWNSKLDKRRCNLWLLEVKPQRKLFHFMFKNHFFRLWVRWLTWWKKKFFFYKNRCACMKLFPIIPTWMGFYEQGPDCWHHTTRLLGLFTKESL